MLALQFTSFSVQPPTQSRHDLPGWDAYSRLLETQPGCICASVELGLHAPVLHRLAYCGFQKIGQGFAFAQHLLEIGAQLRLDADLRKDGGLHFIECVANVLQRQAQILARRVSAWAGIQPPVGSPTWGLRFGYAQAQTFCGAAIVYRLTDKPSEPSGFRAAASSFGSLSIVYRLTP